MNLAPKTSEEFLDLLKRYHKTTTSRTEVKALLAREHDIHVRYVHDCNHQVEANANAPL